MELILAIIFVGLVIMSFRPDPNKHKGKEFGEGLINQESFIDPTTAINKHNELN